MMVGRLFYRLLQFARQNTVTNCNSREKSLFSFNGNKPCEPKNPREPN